jgi:curved DNA-binding protein CbpA
MKNYYKELNITEEASLEEVKKAYRKLAMKYHPDRNAGSKSSEEKFKKILEAYNELTKYIQAGKPSYYQSKNNTYHNGNSTQNQTNNNTNNTNNGTYQNYDFKRPQPESFFYKDYKTEKEEGYIYDNYIFNASRQKAYDKNQYVYEKEISLNPSIFDQSGYKSEFLDNVFSFYEQIPRLKHKEFTKQYNMLYNAYQIKVKNNTAHWMEQLLFSYIVINIYASYIQGSRKFAENIAMLYNNQALVAKTQIFVNISQMLHAYARQLFTVNINKQTKEMWLEDEKEYFKSYHAHEFLLTPLKNKYYNTNLLSFMLWLDFKFYHRTQFFNHNCVQRTQTYLEKKELDVVINNARKEKPQLYEQVIKEVKEGQASYSAISHMSNMAAHYLINRIGELEKKKGKLRNCDLFCPSHGKLAINLNSQLMSSNGNLENFLLKNKIKLKDWFGSDPVAKVQKTYNKSAYSFKKLTSINLSRLITVLIIIVAIWAYNKMPHFSSVRNMNNTYQNQMENR